MAYKDIDDEPIIYYMIRDCETGAFLTESNTWSLEYPDGEIFRTWKAAEKRFRSYRLMTHPHSLRIEEVIL